MCLHIPSLKRKKREPKEVRGGLVEPEVQPSLLGFLLSCSLACGSSMLCTCLGERSRKSLQLVMLEISPTLILVPVFIQKKNKSGNKRDSAGVEYRGVKTLLNQIMFLFGALNFYFILFCIFILCYYIFFSWQAK